jgi:hypothetical protein
MSLAPTFQFSQHALQDYLECRRRFQLRYLLRQPWPAVQSEPLSEFERLMDLGLQFHQLLRRHNLGISEQELARTIQDPDLRRWWRNYLESPPPDLPTTARHPEIALSAPVAGHRLTARYDLLAVEPGRRAVVVDWKTGRGRPDGAALAARMQTRVYRYVLVRAGANFNRGTALQPEQVTMIYWFAEHPAQPEILPYDTLAYQEDKAFLSDLIARIETEARGVEGEWPLTTDERLCRFCTYRSLCDRGVLPGPLSEFDTDEVLDLGLEFEFEEIEEIEY